MILNLSKDFIKRGAVLLLIILLSITGIFIGYSATISFLLYLLILLSIAFLLVIHEEVFENVMVLMFTICIHLILSSIFKESMLFYISSHYTLRYNYILIVMFFMKHFFSEILYDFSIGIYGKIVWIICIFTSTIIILILAADSFFITQFSNKSRIVSFDKIDLSLCYATIILVFVLTIIKVIKEKKNV